MINWIKKQWWIGPAGLFATILAALFSEAFSTIGAALTSLFINYWLLIAITIIIILLLAILSLLLKQQKEKSDPSA